MSATSTPTAPLTEGHPDAWHHIRDAGGYEWWYFDALDVRGDQPVAVVGILYCGFPFTPAYYTGRARQATTEQAASDPYRLSRDPLDHVAASLSVTHGTSVIATGVHEFASKHFHAETDRPCVQVGRNTFREENGVLRLSMDLETIGLGRKIRSPGWNQHTTVDLQFTPASPMPLSQLDLSGEGTAVHAWHAAAPRCRVQGTIVRTGAFAGETTIDGWGYHDHNLGTRPLDQDIQTWVWARCVSEDVGIVFYDAATRTGRSRRSLGWWTRDAGWVEASAVACRATRRRFDPLIFRHPSKIDVTGTTASGGTARLTLEVTDVLESAPFYLRALVRWQGTLEQNGNVQQVDHIGIQEYLRPARLRWPIVQAMLRTRMKYNG